LADGVRQRGVVLHTCRHQSHHVLIIRHLAVGSLGNGDKKLREFRNTAITNLPPFLTRLSHESPS
jgi:hypothetical protein